MLPNVPGMPVRATVFLEGKPAADDLKLAESVCHALEELQPQNPGREKTFHWKAVGEPGKVDLRMCLIIRQGWILMVRRVERFKGGWRATVRVSLRANNPDGAMLQIKNQHFEVYVCRDGKISLEQEGVDPNCDPAGGLTGAIF